MKQFFLSSILSLILLTGMAQSAKYQQTMLEKVAAVDTTYSVSGLVALANTFERIGDAEKNQWLPYYYSAFAHVNSGLMQMNGATASVDASVADATADKADAALNKASALTTPNAEIEIVRKMIANLRMMADPMQRYMTYGPIGTAALEKAKSMDRNNPRIYMLEGQDKFFTPEQFGGSKAEAKALFELALQKFDAFKPETALHPSWGRRVVQYFLDQIK